MNKGKASAIKRKLFVQNFHVRSTRMYAEMNDVNEDVCENKDTIHW
jgi:hypothetical protein